MSKLNRRSFLMSTAQMSGAAIAMQCFTARGAQAATLDGGSRRHNRCDGDYGPLEPKASKNTGEVLLALPEGFKYNVFGQTGAMMSDGRPTPPAHDGMAAFEDGDRRIRLVRNHEVRASAPGTAIDPASAYDPTTGGGTTTLIIDVETRLPIRDFLSVNGTLVNCAGGPTPWGSWITCEETVQGLGQGFGKPHGYVFEVPAKSNRPVAAVPLKGLGRFTHEAIAVDPRTSIVYQTEDSNPAGFYRFIPNRRGKLALGGRLQMLAVKDSPNYDARTGQQVNRTLQVTWVDIDDPDTPEVDNNSLAIQNQGAAKGAANFTRLEGCWYGNSSIFFTSTDGGDAGLGQVWEYKPRGNSGGHLTLLFESPAATVLDSPDNICVTPGGGLILCEDGSGDSYLRGLTQRGEIFDFALNMVPGFSTFEWAGATFSPDGETLFVNIQTPGLTFAIWGPWEDGAL